jgi:hypothetical protein
MNSSVSQLGVREEETHENGDFVCVWVYNRDIIREAKR